jgi:hypothetical protein
MEKVSSADPVMGPTEDKVPTTMCIKHADLPGLEEAALGDRVKIIVTGKITSNRAADKNFDGDTTIEVTSIENAEPVKKENAATMHLEKLKAKLPKKEEVEKESPEEEKSKDEEKD